MAAVAERPGRLEVLDLRHLRAEDLAPLLEEESGIWADKLHWDFSASCEIVRRYLDQRALAGYALLDGRRVAGYSYFVPEEHKALVGDLFVSEPYCTAENEHRLLRHVIGTAQHLPGVRRIEGQLMMLESAAAPSLFPPAEMAFFDRNFMLLKGVQRLNRDAFGPPCAARLVLERWSERWIEEAAQLIARCYQSHVDSHINDQYGSLFGARRFLHNIMQYLGCGSFHAPAAWVAFDAAGELGGLVLTSLVAPRAGHVTQLCVAPPLRGLGLGSELMWRATEAFQQAGCDVISLTVTASNAGAVQLYERIGFRIIRRFRAYVWRNFRR